MKYQFLLIFYDENFFFKFPIKVLFVSKLFSFRLASSCHLRFHDDPLRRNNVLRNQKSLVPYLALITCLLPMNTSRISLFMSTFIPSRLWIIKNESSRGISEELVERVFSSFDILSTCWLRVWRIMHANGYFVLQSLALPHEGTSVGRKIDRKRFQFRFRGR